MCLLSGKELFTDADVMSHGWRADLNMSHRNNFSVPIPGKSTAIVTDSIMKLTKAANSGTNSSNTRLCTRLVAPRDLSPLGLK